MSRIGKQPITIPDDVKIKVEKDVLTINGPKGELKQFLFKELSVQMKDQKIVIERVKENDSAKALHGLLRSLIANAVEGVSKGFEKRLELVGTGYRVKKEGDKLVLSLGFSHPVTIDQTEGISLDIEGQKEIIIKGIDKQKVGQTAAEIRSLRKPEPYKGKGIRYAGEVVRRKPGKAAKVGSGAGGSE